MSNYLSCLLDTGRDASPPSSGNISLTQPFARLYELNDIDYLLACHDWKADAGQDPGHGTIHLVRSCHLKSACRPGVGEEHTGLWVCWGAWLSWRGSVERGGVRWVGGDEERGREKWGGEGEQVEGYEEEFVEEAEEEEDGLVGNMSVFV